MSRSKTWRTQRVNEVYKMLLAGLRRPEIMRLCREKHGWDAAPRTIDAYIAEAKALFEEEARFVRGVELGKAIARLDSLYAKAEARKDHRAALQVEHERIELLGLKEPKRSELSGPGGGPIVVVPGALQQLEDEIVAGVVARADPEHQG